MKFVSSGSRCNGKFPIKKYITTTRNSSNCSSIHKKCKQDIYNTHLKTLKMKRKYVGLSNRIIENLDKSNNTSHSLFGLIKKILGVLNG